MIEKLIDTTELIALRTSPAAAIYLFGKLPALVHRRLQTVRFQQTVRLAARAPFYQEEFGRRDIDPRSVTGPGALGDLYTTTRDLLDNGPEAFTVDRADTAFETTGTTSNLPKRVFFSYDELDLMGRTSALGLYQLGLRRDDVIVSAFDVSFWVSPAVLRSALQYLGCFHVEAGKLPPHEFYERVKRYRPTVIFGEPSWLYRVSEIAAVEGTWPVKFIFAGGENLAESTRERVQDIWGAPYYLNYGQTESFGVVGVECPAKQGYHRNDLNFLFEIADAGPDGLGELVYTTLTRTVMPLIRYRSADVTRLIDEPCTCGLFAKRIAKIVGRCDEMIVCGMGNISPWVFTEVLRDIKEIRDEWQVRVWHEGHSDVVEVLIETAATNGHRNGVGLAEQVRNNLRERFPDFWNNLQMGLYELRVAAVPPLTLRSARKLQRIVAFPAPPPPVDVLAGVLPRVSAA